MKSDQILTRRQALKVAGAAGAVYLAAPQLGSMGTSAPEALAAGACAKLTPELTEGPYWVNTMLRRCNIRANANGGARQAGVPLNLYINVVDSSDRCAPLDGVAVDIWHANAHGIYSDEASQTSGGGDSSSATDTITDNFLRGYQVTGKDKGLSHKPVNGQVSFATVWPGWYAGRAIHIHVRVRRLSHAGKTIAGYTTQIFFSDSDNDRIFNGAAPYNTREPKDDPTTDENDVVLSSADFATNIVPTVGSVEKGFKAIFDIVLDNSEVDAAGGLGRPDGGGPPA
jgi:protocatechuate 3,4-dioxygenase beta subunit